MIIAHCLTYGLVLYIKGGLYGLSMDYSDAVLFLLDAQKGPTLIFALKEERWFIPIKIPQKSVLLWVFFNFPEERFRCISWQC